MELLAFGGKFEALALLPGAVGLLCQLTWPLMRSRRSILIVQAGIGLGYAAQYGLLGAWSGASVAFLGAFQTLLVLASGSPRPDWRIVAPVFGLLLLATATTWSGLPSVLAFGACALTMLGRLQADTLRLRKIQLLAAPFGAAHDIVVGALPALCGVLLSTAVALVALCQEQARGSVLSNPVAS